jgi:hypothetical protein
MPEDWTASGSFWNWNKTRKSRRTISKREAAAINRAVSRFFDKLKQKQKPTFVACGRVIMGAWFLCSSGMGKFPLSAILFNLPPVISSADPVPQFLQQPVPIGIQFLTGLV